LGANFRPPLDGGPQTTLRKEGFDALSDKVLISIVSHMATSAMVSSKKVRVTN